jgi:hypothetical protein
MQEKAPDTWGDWMAAERAGDQERADQALGAAMRALPRRTPSAELSARLMAAASVARASAPRRAASERLVVAGLVGGALAMTLLPVTVLAALVLADAGRIVSGLARGAVWVSDWVNAGVSIWTVLAHMGQALGHAASSPSGSFALTLALLAASSALLVLNRYLPVERS